MGLFGRKDWNVIARVTSLDQVWDMFAPYPMTEDGWFVLRGVLHNGQYVNLWEPGEPLPYTKPARVNRTYRNQRWRKYLMNTWDQVNRNHRRYFGNWLKYNWDTTQSEGERMRQVHRVEIYYMLERTPPPGQPNPPPEKVSLWSWTYD